MVAVDLSRFDNAGYDPGRPLPIRIAWVAVNRVFFQTAFPWPSSVKASLLRTFGAKVGAGVVIKPRVNVKYPWHIAIGQYSWIGEGVWLDSLGRIDIGANACLSQGVMIETGNHDWSKITFDLIVRGVAVEDGAWAAVRSLLLPGSRLAAHAVLCAGAVLSGDTEAYGIYAGNPAAKLKQREVGGG
jgi:putative colanic acid biosynthesis acetyltransferase WcaF